MPALSSSAAGSTRRPCLSRSALTAPEKTYRCIIRTSRLSGSRERIRVTCCSQSGAAWAYRQPSIPRLTTTTSPSPSRSFAGSVRRFLSSSEWSCSPSSMDPLLPTLPHSSPQVNPPQGSGGDLGGIGAAARHDRGTGPRREAEGIRQGVPPGECEAERRAEGIAGAVRVHDGTGRRRRRPAHTVRRAAGGTFRDRDGRRADRSVVCLAAIPRAADEQVERHVRLAQCRELPRHRGEKARAPCRPQRFGVARDEEHRVVSGERQGAAWSELLADDGDRALARSVDVHPSAPSGAEPLRVDIEPELGEPPFRAPPELVAAEGGEELAAPRESCDLHRVDGTSAGGLREHGFALDDLPRSRHLRDGDEFDPFDVADDRASHRRIIAKYGWAVMLISRAAPRGG